MTPCLRTALPLVIAAILLLPVSSTEAQSSRAPLTVEQAREDLDVLQRALEEAHGGYDRFVERTELARRFATHRARITRPLGQYEFAGLLSEAIAELRDGHARLEFDSLTNAALGSALLLPLRVQLEGEHLIVRANDSPTDRSILPGMELLSINGRSSTDLFAALLPKISPDGFIETGRRHRVGVDFARLHWLYVEQAERYELVARQADGSVVRATIPGITDRERRNVENPVNAAFARNVARLDGIEERVGVAFDADGRTARLRVRAFDGQAFPSTLDSIFRQLRERGTQHLVLDLRGNGGGVDEYGALLVSYFTEQPFRYFDHIHVTTVAPSFATWLPRTGDALRAGSVADPAGGFRITEQRHSGVGTQQPSAPGFRGRLTVLIDGGSFSTTADVAAQLRSRNRAVFIGEETAGTYEGNTSGLNARIILPNSRLSLRVMMYGYWNAVSAVPGGRGIVPDHVVPLRVADILAGRDPAIDMARRLATAP
ncbi:MAG: hypothetical protein KF709_08385 [Gemmatimonadaceae bacterium]|nr:hypothetical protein [Gemmatimonadaceae bacterium]